MAPTTIRTMPAVPTLKPLPSTVTAKRMTDGDHEQTDDDAHEGSLRGDPHDAGGLSC